MKIDIKSIRTQNWIFFSLIVLSLVWVFRKYLFFQDLFIFTDIGSDTMTLFYPNMLEETRHWRTEGMPMWSFSIGIGQGVFGKGVLNPFTWIKIALGPDSIAYFLGWLHLVKIILISIISFHYFKLMKLNKMAIYLGVILCSYLGYVTIGACWYGHLSSILYMFLFLLAFELILMKGKWWLLPIPVVFFLGPKLYFFAEFAIIYILLRLSLLNVLKWKTVFKSIPKFLGPGVLGVLLSAPFLGAVFYKFLYSPRVGGEVSYTKDLMSQSIFRLEDMNHYGTAIMRFFSNDILGTGDDYQGWNNYMEAPVFYAGIISLLLLPQLFRFLNRKQIIVCSSLLCLWAIVIIFPYFRNAFYLFVGNYYKAALSFFIPFTFLLFGVLAFDKISKAKKVNLILLGITSSILLILLFIPFQAIANKLNSEVRLSVTILILIYTTLFVCFNFIKNKAPVQFVLLAVVLFEGVFMANITINKRAVIGVKEYENRTWHNDYTKESLKYIESIDAPFYRVEKTFGSVKSGYNDSQSQGFFGTRSYRSHNHNNYIRFLISMGIIKANDELYTRWVVGLQKIPQLHPLFSLKYMISNQEKKSDVLNWMYEDLGQLNGLNIYKNKYYLPLGIGFSKSISTSEFAQISEYYKKIELLYNAVVIDDQDIENYPKLERISTSQLTGALKFDSYQKNLSNSSMKMESFKQDHFKGSIQLDKASMIMFSFPFDEGWKAKIDGKKSRMIEVDNGLTGVYLEAGSHKIDLKYRPPFYIMGIVIFILSLFLYIYLLYRNRNAKSFALADESTPTTVGLEVGNTKSLRKNPRK